MTEPIDPNSHDTETPTSSREPTSSVVDAAEQDLSKTLPLGSGSLGDSSGRMLAAPPSAPAESSRSPRASAIELLVVDETHVSKAGRRPWRAAEVWTSRRIYGLDATFTCFEIIDRETGRSETKHAMLGARLGGGRLRHDDAVRFSYPLPLPGMEAIFTKDKKHGFTTPIERMVVRVRVLETPAGDAPPTWEDIANRCSEPDTR